MSGVSIGQAARAAGLSVDAIRFYERSGVIAKANRSGGRRTFTPGDIQELSIIVRFRATHMSLPEIARYLALRRAGIETTRERDEIVREHRERVLAQIADLQSTLAILEFKIAHAAELANGTTTMEALPLPSATRPARESLVLIHGGHQKSVARNA